MKRHLKMPAVLALVCCLAGADAVNAEDPPCDVVVINGAAANCPAPQILAYAKECPVTDNIASCLNPNATPYAEIECDGLNGTIWCEAWPQTLHNDNYQYTWSISGGYTPPQSTGSYHPLSTTQCTGNRFVTVTVTGPTGLYDSDTIRVNCSAQ